MAGLLAPQVPFRYTDNNGNPLVGGKVYTYINTTTTLQTTYSNAALSSANTNPITLDSRGEANIYLTPGKGYTFKVTDSLGTVINTTDGIYGAAPAGGSSWFSVLAYGADPTGVADSSAAFQQCVDAAFAANGTVYIPGTSHVTSNPPGYKLASTVYIPNSLLVVGDGMYASMVKPSLTSGVAIQLVEGASGANYGCFRDWSIVGPGQGVAGGLSGISGSETSSNFLFKFENMRISGFNGDGVKIADSFNVVFSKCRIHLNGVKGTSVSQIDYVGGGSGGGVHIWMNTIGGTWTVQAATSISFDDCYFGGSQYGIYCDPTTRIQNFNFNRTWFEFNYLGLYAPGGSNPGAGGAGGWSVWNTLLSCSFENNTFAGAVLGQGTEIETWNFHGASAATSTTSPNGPDGVMWLQGSYNKLSTSSSVRNIMSVAASTAGPIMNFTSGDNAKIALTSRTATTGIEWYLASVGSSGHLNFTDNTNNKTPLSLTGAATPAVNVTGLFTVSGAASLNDTVSITDTLTVTTTAIPNISMSNTTNASLDFVSTQATTGRTFRNSSNGTASAFTIFDATNSTTLLLAYSTTAAANAGKVRVNYGLQIGSVGAHTIGTATLVAGSVTVNTSAVNANSKIFMTRNTVGGTIGNLSAPVASIVAGTSFTITSTNALDTSTVNWLIIDAV